MSATTPETPEDPRRTLGRLGEQLAAEHLERLGYTILARNHRTRFGELDIVACDKESLVFCEVKTRRGRQGGAALDGFGERKRVQVKRMAIAYLADVTDRPRRPSVRLDAVAVTIDPHGRLVALDHREGAW